MPLTFKWTGGRGCGLERRKEGQERRGGRASADLEGLSGRVGVSSNGRWRTPDPNQDTVGKIKPLVSKDRLRMVWFGLVLN